MKYNLRAIKGKRIVGGDPNLATKHEIHVSKIPEELGIITSEEGDNDEFVVQYYNVDYTSLNTIQHIKDAFILFFT